MERQFINELCPGFAPTTNCVFEMSAKEHVVLRIEEIRHYLTLYTLKSAPKYRQETSENKRLFKMSQFSFKVKNTDAIEKCCQYIK